MKIYILLTLLFSISCYNRDAAVNYARQYALGLNHRCGSYIKCTPWSYWGGEHCGYPSQGGDCANFVSQCLIAGGHPYLNTGGNCRGYPCGKEEIGAQKLANCLMGKGWSQSCGRLQGPPGNIQKGDVLVYFKGGCNAGGAHAVIVTQGGSNAKISCHSSMKKDVSYTYMGSSMPYYMWLHYNG